MKNKLKRKAGQGMVEYIIIVAVIAIACLALFGLFGDTIQSKLGGAIKELDSGDNAEAVDEKTKDSESFLKDLNADD